MIFSADKPIIDVFNTPFREMPKDLIHDMEVISKLHGQFGWSEPWAQAMHNWKLGGFGVEGFKPPSHPKLKHYCSRRFAHMIKLSMIASIDRGNSLQLEKQDFNTAMGWMLEAELTMPRIFESGVASQDNEGMSEIIHFVRTMGEVSEAKIVNFARTRVKFATNIPKLIEVLEMGGDITHCGNDRLGLKIFKAP